MSKLLAFSRPLTARKQTLRKLRQKLARSKILTNLQWSVRSSLPVFTFKRQKNTLAHPKFTRFIVNIRHWLAANIVNVLF